MKLLACGSAVLASTAAFTLPQPTLRFAVAPDEWSPAPTSAPPSTPSSTPWLLFHRREAMRDNTCGYVSGSSASPVSCPAATAICATNTYFGVHGCCDPASLSACTIPTTCIPSSAMRTLCSDAACSADNAIAKCTASGALECYRWLFQYDSTVMTQHGCAASAFTSTAVRSYGALSTGGSVALSTFSPLTSPLPSPYTSPHTSPPNTTTTTTTHPIAPIIGGTIGGCTILSLVALAAFFIHRHRRRTSFPTAHPHPHSTPEYSSNGFPPAPHWGSSDAKTWQSAGGGGGGVETGWPPAMAEMHGHDRAVEVEAREKTQNGRWLDTGRGPVEVEARTIHTVGAATEAETKKGEAEKSRWWRASPSASSTSPPSQTVVVEAPT